MGSPPFPPILLRFLASFSPRAVPLMSRQAYRWELSSAFFFPFSLSCVEAMVIGVIAERVFSAPPLAIATVTAAPPLANITSFLWAMLIRGKDRVRAVNLVQIGIVASVLTIALAPINAFGTALLVGAALVGRMCMTGVFTARSDLWGANYPRTDRARITGKFTIVASLAVSAAALLIAVILDIYEEHAETAFRAAYLICAVMGVIGVVLFSRIRWRGRRAARREERAAPADARDNPATPRGMLRVLQRDETYRRYMAAQFMLGVGNLATFPPLILALGAGGLDLRYLPSIALTEVIPKIMPLVAIPFWSKLLDRMHIVRFRVYHSWVFVAANLLLGAGVLLESLPLLFAARLIFGFAIGGGMLAWNLGHHDFAPRGLATIYMGIHVTLTGVRGAIAPFIGTLLYSGWAFSIGDVRFAWEGVRGWTFIILAGVTAIGAIMFLRLSRDIGRTEPPPAPDGAQKKAPPNGDARTQP